MSADDHSDLERHLRATGRASMPPAQHLVHVGASHYWANWRLECLPSCPQESYDEVTGNPVPGEGCWVQSHWGEYTTEALRGEWPEDCWPALAIALYDGENLTLVHCPDDSTTKETP